MYESLRQLILASQSSDADAVFSAMDLAFAIDLCKEEGGGQVKQLCSSLILERAFGWSIVLVLYRNNLDQQEQRGREGEGEGVCEGVCRKDRLTDGEI